MHDQSRIDHAADLARHHGARAGRVPVRDAAGAQERLGAVQILDAGRAAPAVRFEERGQGCRFGEGLEVLQMAREELDVERVRELVGVDGWFVGRVAGGDVHAAVRKGVQQGGQQGDVVSGWDLVLGGLVWGDGVELGE